MGYLRARVKILLLSKGYGNTQHNARYVVDGNTWLPAIRGRQRPSLFPILGLLGNKGHSLLRKGGANDVSGQVFHGLLITWLDSWSAENAKFLMTPLHEHIHDALLDLVFGKQYLENVMAKNLSQVFQLK